MGSSPPTDFALPHRSPSCSPLTPSPTAPAVASGGSGVSLLRTSDGAPVVRGFHVAGQSSAPPANDEDEAAPPPLSAAWATSSALLGSAESGAAGVASGKKKGRKQGVTLLSNSGGRQS